MARVKRSVHAKKKRREVLEQAKGYRGLKKNAHRLFVTCALVNLFLSRRKLLLTASA